MSASDAQASEHIGRPRASVVNLPAYKPGKGIKQAEAEHGITGAIKLASNENPAPPFDPIQEAVVAAVSGLNRYADHRATALREALAGMLGVGVDHVTVGAGSVGLLQQLALTFLDPGDEVVYPWRSFEVYPVYTELMAARSVQVPLNDDWTYDLEAVAAAVTPRTKLIMLATPNNPTGIAVTTGELASLLDAVPSSVIVVIDEAYREFADPALGDPVHDILPRYPNAVVTRTFSKAHGLAGARVGYLVGHPDVVTMVDKTLFPFAVNALAQAAALAALQPAAREEIAARSAAIVAERRRVEDALEARGWTLVTHDANFVWLATGDATDDIALGLEQAGVVVRPFSGEGIRVTIGTPEENDRFVATIDAVVDALTGADIPGKSARGASEPSH